MASNDLEQRGRTAFVDGKILQLTEDRAEGDDRQPDDQRGNAHDGCETHPAREVRHQ